MENRKLYIIGNGFDLWHRIPSSYQEFKEFVREHDPRLLTAVEDYLPADEDWSGLESALAEIDVGSIIDDLEHFMVSYGADDWSDSGHHDFQYEVGRIVEYLSTELRSQFGQWIRQLPVPTPTTASQRLQTIDPTAYFLTFNYTSTLLELYGVCDTHVLHIHGRANLPDNDLILGHAWNPQERQSLNDRSDIEEIDTRLMEAHSILDRYFSNTFKPSVRLIREHRPFFERLTDVERVCVLGHSLSKVDEPYFHALLTLPGIATARWQVACRSDTDARAKSVRLRELGVPVNSIITCAWSDI
jgi:Bacteriophage abortive infection AbiH